MSNTDDKQSGCDKSNSKNGRNTSLNVSVTITKKQTEKTNIEKLKNGAINATESNAYFQTRLINDKLFGTCRISVNGNGINAIYSVDCKTLLKARNTSTIFNILDSVERIELNFQ